MEVQFSLVQWIDICKEHALSQTVSVVVDSSVPDLGTFGRQAAKRLLSEPVPTVTTPPHKIIS